MNKKEFIEELRARLSGLPQSEVEERLGFYAEMIDDRIEEGLTEEQAVREIGSVEDIEVDILSDIPLSKLVKEKIKPKGKVGVWGIVLLVFALPILLSLVASAVAVAVSVYVSIWSVIVSVWAVAISLVAYVPFGIGAAISAFSISGLFLAHIGMAIFALGLSFFVFLGAKKLTVLTCVLTKKLILWVKSLFLRKEKKDE